MSHVGGIEDQLPVKALGKCFRGKFMDGLTRLHKDGQLELPRTLSTPKAFARVRAKLFGKKWVVDARRPFAGAEQVFSYLGLYTHRVAISNHRILEVSEDAVIIKTRGEKTATMSPKQFIGRFLQHILPNGFVKIRHYGLFASSNVKTRLALVQKALESRQPSRQPDSAEDDPHCVSSEELFQLLTGIDLSVCPHCGSRRLRRLTLPRSTAKDRPPTRAPPRVAG